MKNLRIQFKPVATEKAVMLIEGENTLTFTTSMKYNKTSIKKQFEELFDVKLAKLRTSTRNNKKYIYAKLKKEFPAIDLATKIGVI